MAPKTETAALAIEGGPKAFPKMTGKVQPKVGVEEFMSIAERFGFKPEALERIRSAICDDDFLGDGPNLARYITTFPKPAKGEQLEALAREKFGVKHALGTSNGTGALHSAFVGVGVGPGTEVICPAIGFAATALAVIMAGGVPVFCDVDESLQMDPDKIAEKITPRTVAIAPTQNMSYVCDMDPILAIAAEHGLKVVEDCAQSPGATYKGKYVGTLGDVGCFSISAYKIIGASEGGMAITNDDRIFERLCQCAEAGGLWRPVRFAQPRYDGELFPGTNYRLSELEAAADLIQLKKLDDVVGRYRRVGKRILSRLKSFREITPRMSNDPEGDINYALRFFPQSHDLGRKIVEALKAEGLTAWTYGPDHDPDWHLSRTMFPIILKTGHIPGGSVFEDPRYIDRGGNVEYRPDDCPVANDLFARAVSISLNQWYSEEDCQAIASGINKVLSAYCTEGPMPRPWI